MTTQPVSPASAAALAAPIPCKRLCVAAVAAGSLLLSALPASTITVNILEDSSTRFVYELLWGEVPDPSLPQYLLFSFSSGAVHFAYAEDRADSILSYNNHAFVDDDFYLRFNNGVAGFRSFEVADLDGFGGSQALALDGNPYGARFVYEAPSTNPPTGVPDHGATALLLAAGLSGLTLLRRSFV
jgi:hypothetical protein